MAYAIAVCVMTGEGRWGETWRAQTGGRYVGSRQGAPDATSCGQLFDLHNGWIWTHLTGWSAACRTSWKNHHRVGPQHRSEEQPYWRRSNRVRRAVLFGGPDDIDPARPGSEDRRLTALTW